MGKGVGDHFQESTKYVRGSVAGPPEDVRKPETFKTYATAPKIKLNAPDMGSGPGLWDLLRRRRSVRDFEKTPLSRAELSQLLWAGQGITGTGHGHALRTAPSAGSLYPVETYLAVNAVEAITPGIYHYDIPGHGLEQLIAGDFRVFVAQAALDQEMAYWASVVFIWTAIFDRAKWKYGQRAYRYVYLDAGHLAQNVALAAVALGLGCCQVAALYDHEVNALLDVNGKSESVIYMAVVGKPKPQ